MTVLKLVSKADRDPALGQFCGPEFQVRRNMGLIPSTGDVPIIAKGGVIAGIDAHIAVHGWNPVITFPEDTLLDFTPQPGDYNGWSVGFPRYSNPWWDAAMKAAYPKNSDRDYNAGYGGKGGEIVELGRIKLIGTTGRWRIKSFTQGQYGNVAGILGQPPGKDAAGNYLPSAAKVWLENGDIEGCDNGARGDFVWFHERGVKYVKDGSGTGQTHARYIKAQVFVSSDCSSEGTKVGHDYKLRSYGLSAIYRPKFPLNAAGGDSYRIGADGGMVFLVEGDVSDGPGDSNAYTMFRFSVNRDPWGPHVWAMFAVRADANLSVKGNFLSIDDPANAFIPVNALGEGGSAWNNGGWKTAQQLVDVNGNKVWMPITIIADGCDFLSNSNASSYSKSLTKDGMLIVPAGHAINLLPGNNRNISRDDPAAATPATHLDLSKLDAFDRVGAIVKAGVDPAYWTDETLDAAVALVNDMRAKWEYPKGAVPAPTPVPPIIVSGPPATDPPASTDTPDPVDPPVVTDDPPVVVDPKDALIQGLQDQVAGLTADLKTAQDSLYHAADDLRTAMGTVNTLKQSLNDSQQHEKSLESQIAELKGDVKEFVSDFEKLKGDVADK